MGGGGGRAQRAQLLGENTRTVESVVYAPNPTKSIEGSGERKAEWVYEVPGVHIEPD